MTPELSTKIINYIQDNGLTFTPRAEVLSKMVSEGVITQAEYEEVINGNIYALSQTEGETSIGDSVSISDCAQNTAQTQAKSKPHHPLFKELELDQNGKIDMNQFTIEALEEKYNSDAYTIEKISDDEGAITIIVTNKASGKSVDGVILTPDDYGILLYTKCNYNSDGDIKSAVTIRDKKIRDYTEYNSDKSYTVTAYDDGDVTKISSKAKYNPDYSYTITKFKSPNVSIVANYDADDQLISCEKYVNGQKIADCDEDENSTNNAIIEEIFKALQTQSSDHKELIEDIKTKINEQNINEIVKDYYQKYNEPFFTLIENSLKLTHEEKRDLLKYLYETMSKTEETSYATAQVINNIALSNFDGDAKTLKDNINQINSKNVLEIVKAFGGYASDEEESFLGKRTIERILEMIDLSSMSDEEKMQCKKHLVDNLISYATNNKIYCNDIKKDIYSHFEDETKFNIDFRRLVARVDTQPDDEKVSIPNGKLDVDYAQGSTGDCWLIAGLKSIAQKDGGKDVLNSLLKVDNNNKTVTVTFPNVGKSYTISFYEIDKSTHLASGDGDIRALEIAIDRYKKESAYQSDEDDKVDAYGFEDEYDINGDLTSLLYELILGGSNMIENVDMMTWKPDDANVPMTLSVDDENAIVSAIDLDTYDIIQLDTSHSYVLDSVDDENIYLIDPREKGNNKILVKRSDFEDSEISIELGINPKNV